MKHNSAYRIRKAFYRQLPRSLIGFKIETKNLLGHGKGDRAMNKWMRLKLIRAVSVEVIAPRMLGLATGQPVSANTASYFVTE